jgi:uncharacterized membrane protein AbrB (regulator of aidB expression)
MSVVQRVIVLNKPFKIRGYTIVQWLILGVAAVAALFLASKMPQNWKINGAPAGVFVFVIVLGAGIAYVSATQMKPPAWWRNKILYGLRIVPHVYLPNREEAQVYPDPTIIERGKREDQGYYVESDDQ